jgi:transcriptional antiterminator NusG
MSHPTDDTTDPVLDSGRPAEADADAKAEPAPRAPGADAPAFEVEEQTPAGAPAEPSAEAPAEPSPEPAPEPARATSAGDRTRDKDRAREKKAKAPATAVAEAEAEAAEPTSTVGVDDDEEVPELVWYVLKVQSSREDTIRDALERRVKIQGLERYFGRIVVPTEKITEIRNNKKRIVERKTYPGYIMVEMELNEKTWFVVRETPGVGDFVGAHGTPTKMTETEVNQMLGQQTAAETEQAPKVRIDVERGDRVKIKDGPFENFEGTVEEVIEARGLVKVMLIIFNRPTPVDLEYWQVERI